MTAITAYSPYQVSNQCAKDLEARLAQELSGRARKTIAEVNRIAHQVLVATVTIVGGTLCSIASWVYYCNNEASACSLTAKLSHGLAFLSVIILALGRGYINSLEAQQWNDPKFCMQRLRQAEREVLRGDLPSIREIDRKYHALRSRSILTKEVISAWIGKDFDRLERKETCLRLFLHKHGDWSLLNRLNADKSERLRQVIVKQGCRDTYGKCLTDDFLTRLGFSKEEVYCLDQRGHFEDLQSGKITFRQFSQRVELSRFYLAMPEKRKELLQSFLSWAQSEGTPLQEVPAKYPREAGLFNLDSDWLQQRAVSSWQPAPGSEAIEQLEEHLRQYGSAWVEDLDQSARDELEDLIHREISALPLKEIEKKKGLLDTLGFSYEILVVEHWHKLPLLSILSGDERSAFLAHAAQNPDIWSNKAQAETEGSSVDAILHSYAKLFKHRILDAEDYRPQALIEIGRLELTEVMERFGKKAFELGVLHPQDIAPQLWRYLAQHAFQERHQSLAKQHLWEDIQPYLSKELLQLCEGFQERWDETEETYRVELEGARELRDDQYQQFAEQTAQSLLPFKQAWETQLSRVKELTAEVHKLRTLLLSEEKLASRLEKREKDVQQLEESLATAKRRLSALSRIVANNLEKAEQGAIKLETKICKVEDGKYYGKSIKQLLPWKDHAEAVRQNPYDSQCRAFHSLLSLHPDRTRRGNLSWRRGQHYPLIPTNAGDSNVFIAASSQWQSTFEAYQLLGRSEHAFKEAQQSCAELEKSLEAAQQAVSDAKQAIQERPAAVERLASAESQLSQHQQSLAQAEKAHAEASLRQEKFCLMRKKTAADQFHAVREQAQCDRQKQQAAIRAEFQECLKVS